MKELIRQSAKKLSAAILKKEIKATELVFACIRQIESINPKLNAVVRFNPEKAMLEAKEKDDLLSKNKICSSNTKCCIAA